MFKNKKMLVITAVLFLNLTANSGCMMMMGKGMMMGGDMNKKDDVNMDMKHTTGAKESKSYIITQRYCTQCHELKENTLYEKEEWKPIVHRMFKYTQEQGKLKPNKYEKVMIEHYYGIE